MGIAAVRSTGRRKRYVAQHRAWTHIEIVDEGYVRSPFNTVLAEYRKREAMKDARKRIHPIPKIQSLRELEIRAATDKRYERLAIVSASNLGGDFNRKSPQVFQLAMHWLRMNAVETWSETGGGEEGVVDEVNFCRDLVVSEGVQP